MAQARNGLQRALLRWVLLQCCSDAILVQLPNPLPTRRQDDHQQWAQAELGRAPLMISMGRRKRLNLILQRANLETIRTEQPQAQRQWQMGDP